MKRLLPLLAAMALLLALAPTAGATHVSLRLYESNAQSGDAQTFYASISNLDNISKPDGCARIQFDPSGNDWNNCASSLLITLPSATCLRLYNSVNYTYPFGPTWRGPFVNRFYELLTFEDDILTSFKFYAC